jgi:hypothetical protein
MPAASAEPSQIASCDGESQFANMQGRVDFPSGPAASPASPFATSVSDVHLGEAQLTIKRQSDALTALRGELADARSALARWEETLVNPDRLNITTTGHAEHDQQVAAMSARVEQYTHALQESQSKLAAVTNKHQA